MKYRAFERMVCLIMALIMVITVLPGITDKASAETYTGIIHQTDLKYQNVRYDGVSLASCGSGIFSLVNAVGYLTGEQMDVVAVANWAYSQGCFGGWGTNGPIFYPKASQRFGPLYGFTVDANGGGGYNGSIRDVRLNDHLKAGGTAVAFIEDHYIALVGYNSNMDLYYVFDSTPGTIEGTPTDTGEAWVTEEQLSTGTGEVTWYCLISPGPLDAQEPVISNIQVTDISCAGYTVICTVTDNHEVEKVAFPTWTLADGQDDLNKDFMNTQLGTQNGNTFTFRVNSSEHNYESGYYVTHIYAVDRSGNTSSATTGNTQLPGDYQNPVISDVEITELSAAGYTISCKVTDNWDVQTVVFPTWSVQNGQDDLKADWWNTQKGTRNGDRYTFRVNASEHKYETGDYVTHIYAKDVVGNQAVVNLPVIKVMDDKQAPVITNAFITNVTPAGYTVTCKVTDNWGIHSVAFPTWTEYNGQDDLPADFMTTQRGIKNEDIYTFKVRVSDHNGESGLYSTHIYAKDSAGNLTIVSLDAVLVNTTETWIEKLCFDPTIYRARNKDLAQMNNEQLKDHWLMEGILEGRVASVILDLDYYMNNNPDLKALYGNDYAALYKHFVTTGYKEVRKSSPAFDGAYYLTKYSDVAQQYPENYIQHYVEKGMAEGRRASEIFDPNYYWYLKPEVAAAHPNDYWQCVMHFMAYGATEGIKAYDEAMPVISNATITDVSAAGYTVTCTVTDNWGVERVVFPTWTLANDQDDLDKDFMNTQQGTKRGNTYTFHVKASAHNNEGGLYVTHIYAIDKGGNRASVKLDPLEVRDTYGIITLKPDASYKTEYGLLTNVNPGTKVSALLTRFENDDLEVRDRDGKTISGNTKLSTGATIRRYMNGELTDTLTVVVSGDVNGDGVVDATDYLRAKAALMGQISLSRADRRAADVDNSKVLDTTDYIRIKGYLMGIINLWG